VSAVVAALCAVTSLACALLLCRSWLATRFPLLLWCMVCFGGLALNNALLVIQEVTGEDLRPWIQVPAALGVGVLCLGLVLRGERR